jgi:hypothetical protein
VTVLDRNFGTFNTTTAITVTRSTGSYGTGTVIAVIFFGNTVISTPASCTQRTNSVVNLGLYGYDAAGTGQASIAFTATSAGSGVWFAWELSAGSTYLSSNSAQDNVSATSETTPTLTPTAGNRHLFTAIGGSGSGATRSVTGVSNSFINLAGTQVGAQDWPFAYRAERDVVGDGVTGFSTVGTFNAAAASAGGSVIMSFINNAGDVTAPTVPTGLATTAVGSTTASLSWTASTDAVGVTGYELQVIGP